MVEKSWWQDHGTAGHVVCSQEAARHEMLLSVYFLLCTQSWTPVRGTLLPTFRGNLLSLVKQL